MEKYDSSKHYHLIVEAARAAGTTSLCAIAHHLEANGVIWPKLQDNWGRSTPEQDEMDKEITRAWAETGIHPKK